MDWFLYDNGLRHERVKNLRHYFVTILFDPELLTLCHYLEMQALGTKYCCFSQKGNNFSKFIANRIYNKILSQKITCTH